MKPTIVKIANGTDRADRLPVNEPIFNPIIEADIDALDEFGKKEWDRIFPLMKERGLATEADLFGLMEWCRVVAKMRYLATKCTNEDMVVSKNMAAGINQVVNPYEKLYDSYFDKMLKLCAKFGFTPADRTRINMPEPMKQDNVKDLIVRAGGL
jgi:P27 family predicted phage terminase small subunit